MIAIDANAPPPARPRWFSLDTPAMHALLAAGPALIHWVEHVDDIEPALRDYPDTVEVLEASRRDYRWRIGVPADGHLPCAGRCPGHAVLRTPLGERMLPWRRVE